MSLIRLINQTKAVRQSRKALVLSLRANCVSRQTASRQPKRSEGRQVSEALAKANNGRKPVGARRHEDYQIGRGTSVRNRHKHSSRTPAFERSETGRSSHKGKTGQHGVSRPTTVFTGRWRATPPAVPQRASSCRRGGNGGFASDKPNPV